MRVSALGAVYGRAAVQLVQDKAAQLVKALCYHADPPLQVLTEDEAVEHYAVEIRPQHAEGHGPAVVDEGRKQRAGVYGVERKAPAEHREAQRDERSVQNERDERHGQIHHAVYDYRRPGDAAHRRPAHSRPPGGPGLGVGEQRYCPLLRPK